VIIEFSFLYFIFINHYAGRKTCRQLSELRLFDNFFAENNKCRLIITGKIGVKMTQKCSFSGPLLPKKNEFLTGDQLIVRNAFPIEKSLLIHRLAFRPLRKKILCIGVWLSDFNLF